MIDRKLYIVMVGLPARGKSTIAFKLKENLVKDSIKARIFNNGKLRRQLIASNTADSSFYDPQNPEGVGIREKIAGMNIQRAGKYLDGHGQVAILDATNVQLERRRKISSMLSDHPILFVGCDNHDQEILEASILRKVGLPEFSHLTKGEAIQNFRQRIEFYQSIQTPLEKERNYIYLDSLNNRIVHEEITDSIPFYDHIRDFLVTDSVKNLYLVRHGETYYNLENRIGGDSGLTPKGQEQANKLAEYFCKKRIPFIFTSKKIRTVKTAEPIGKLQKKCFHDTSVRVR